MRKAISLMLAVLLCLSACGSREQESSETAVSAASAGESRTQEDTSGEESRTQETEISAPEKTKVRLGLLAGPTGMGAAGLLAANEEGSSLNDYEHTLFNAPTDVLPKLIGGELDIAAVPTNLAAMLYQKTNGEVRLLALNTLGVLYLLTAPGENISSVEDLRGKTVYSSGQAAVPEYVLNYILEAFGLKDEVNVIYEAEHDAVIAAIASGKAQIAVLPEPKVTAALSKVEGLMVALDLTEEWDRAVEKCGKPGCMLSMGCVVVRKTFAEEHPEAVANFMKEYEASVAYMNEPSNADEAAALCERFAIIPKAEVAKKALPNAKLCFVTAEEMRTQIAPFYQILFDFDPAAVGGKLPDEAFYYVG